MALVMALALVMGVGGVGVSRVEAAEGPKAGVTLYNVIEGPVDGYQCDSFVETTQTTHDIGKTWGELRAELGTPTFDIGHTFSEWVLIDVSTNVKITDSEYTLENKPYMVYALYDTSKRAVNVVAKTDYIEEGDLYARPRNISYVELFDVATTEHSSDTVIETIGEKINSLVPENTCYKTNITGYEVKIDDDVVSSVSETQNITLIPNYGNKVLFSVQRDFICDDGFSTSVDVSLFDKETMLKDLVDYYNDNATPGLFTGATFTGWEYAMDSYDEYSDTKLEDLPFGLLNIRAKYDSDKVGIMLWSYEKDFGTSILVPADASYSDVLKLIPNEFKEDESANTKFIIITDPESQEEIKEFKLEPYTSYLVKEVAGDVPGADVSGPEIDLDSLTISKKYVGLNEDITISVKVTDESDILRVGLSWVNYDNMYGNEGVYNKETGMYDITVSAPVYGPNDVIRINAKDVYGNETKYYDFASFETNWNYADETATKVDLSKLSFEVDTTIENDKTAPEIDLSTLAISKNNPEIDERINLSLKVSDPTGILIVELLYDNPDNGYQTSGIYNEAKDCYDFEISSPVIGKNELVWIKAKDLYGNSITYVAKDSTSKWLPAEGTAVDLTAGDFTAAYKGIEEDTEAPTIDISSISIQKNVLGLNEHTTLSVKANDNVGIMRVELLYVNADNGYGSTAEYNARTGFYDFDVYSPVYGENEIAAFTVTDRSGNKRIYSDKNIKRNQWTNFEGAIQSNLQAGKFYAGIIDAATGVCVSNSTMDGDTRLNVSEKEMSGDAYSKLHSDGSSTLEFFEISIAGNIDMTEESAKVFFDISDVSNDGDTITIKHLLKNNTVQTETCVVTNGMVNMDVNEFSPFLLEKTRTNNTSGTVNGGNNSTGSKPELPKDSNLNKDIEIKGNTDSSVTLEKDITIGTNDTVKASDGATKLSEAKAEAIANEITKTIAAAKSAADAGNKVEKTIVKVELADATVVPEQILEAAKGKDVDVVLEMEGGYSWTINGNDITDADLKEINLEVKLDAEEIPADKVKDLAGDKVTKQISLTHDGEFGFAATLTVNLGADNKGKFGNLYYYNKDGELEFMNAGSIDENGNVQLGFTHASDYVIVVDEKAATKEEETVATTAPKTGDASNTAALLIVMVMALATTAGVLVKRKNGIRYK